MHDDNIAKAWSFFVKNGHIGPYSVRPEILRSWERSYHVGHIDSMFAPGQLPDEEFFTVYSGSLDLVTVARPVMEYLHCCFPTNLMILNNKEGYCLDQVPYFQEYPEAIGRDGSESSTGTSSIAITLTENIPYRTTHFENYLVRYHTYDSASAPIIDADGALIGVITMNNPRGIHLPENVLHILVLAAKMISNCLAKNASFSTKDNTVFLEMLNQIEKCVAVVNPAGLIVNANKHFVRALGIKKYSSVVGTLWKQHVAEGPALSDLAADAEVFLKGADGKIPFRVVGAHTGSATVSDGNSVLVLDSLYAADWRQLDGEYRYSRSDANGTIIGKSKKMMQIKQLISKVAAVHQTTVLIEGESGTGKELIAKAIHEESGRSGALVSVNCGAIPKELIQSELFGYVGGAFTGAEKGGKIGKIEIADGGTLFLDEIGEMSLEMQVVLLRFLEDKIVTRLGSNKSVKVDVNIIAATNRDLRRAIAEGTFRSDLYYRLSVVNILIPPLRERKEDIPQLVEHISQQLSDQLGKPSAELDRSAISRLTAHSWPGNVRELRNVLENAMICCSRPVISADDLYIFDPKTIPALAPKMSEKRRKSEIPDKDRLTALLQRNRGNIKKTAEDLSLSRNTLYKYIRLYGIDQEPDKQ